MITAAPTLTVAGLTIARALAGAPALVAVDALHLTWGRAGVLEQPTPATASVVVLDRSPGATFARRTDLIGQPVLLGWSGSDGSAGSNFRGRITDVQARPLPGAVAGAGFVVTLAASSVEVDLGNYHVDEGTTWPAESFADRRARLAGLLPAGMFTGGLVLPDRTDLGMQAAAVPAADLGSYPAAQIDAGGRSVLELLHELYASTSPLPMVYDPGADRLTFAPRRRFAYAAAGLIMSAGLVASPDHGGRYVAASLSGRHLDAQQLGYSGTLGQQVDSRITRVEVGWYITPNFEQRTTWWATSYTAAEPTIGRRTLAVSSIHAEGANAVQLAQLYADVANREGSLPRLGAVNYSTGREPLHDASHAAVLLAGHEAGGTLFLGRSWLSQLGQRPLVGLIGGATSYAAGEWSVDLTPAPVDVDPEGFSWTPLTAAALKAQTPAVRLADVDRSVTLGDLRFLDVAPGRTTLTMLPYRGNPNP